MDHTKVLLTFCICLYADEIPERLEPTPEARAAAASFLTEVIDPALMEPLADEEWDEWVEDLNDWGEPHAQERGFLGSLFRIGWLRRPCDH